MLNKFAEIVGASTFINLSHSPPTMLSIRNFIVLLSIALATSACVGKKKYDEMEQRLQTQLNNERKNASEERKKNEAKIAELSKSLEGRDKELAELRNRYNSLEALHKQLEQSYKEARELNEHLKNNLSENQRQLAEQLAAKDEELRKKAALLADLEKKLAQREARLKELEAALAERDRKARELRESILRALAGFSSSDLSVYEKDGKIYVSLSQNLLFAKGSATLDKKGADALAKLAAVLNRPESAEISVLVEGHTDSDGDEKLNWKLSTDRSLTVSQHLIDNKVNPARITAAGRGEHAPIVLNDTEANKSKNRRTDIILEPKLDEIYKAINGN